MQYESDYAKGQILVFFKDGSKEFVRDFGKLLGYNLSEENYEHGEAYIFETDVGKEKEAVKIFTAYPDFVSSASLRDIKIEGRWNSLEKALSMVQELHDDAEIPDDKYNSRIEKIINLFSTLKTN